MTSICSSRRCDSPIRAEQRSDARYCSDACRNREWHAKRGDATAKLHEAMYAYEEGDHATWKTLTAEGVAELRALSRPGDSDRVAAMVADIVARTSREMRREAVRLLNESTAALDRGDGARWQELSQRGMELFRRYPRPGESERIAALVDEILSRDDS